MNGLIDLRFKNPSIYKRFNYNTWDLWDYVECDNVHKGTDIYKRLVNNPCYDSARQRGTISVQGLPSGKYIAVFVPKEYKSKHLKSFYLLLGKCRGSK